MSNPPASELTLREASLADVPAMVEVLEEAFPQWPAFDIDVSAAKHLRWKMSAPGGVPSAPSVGLVDGKIVAVATRWSARGHAGGEGCVISTAADLAIAPAMQSRGFGRPLSAHSRATAARGGFMGMRTPSRNARVPRLYDRADRDERGELSAELNVWVRPGTLRTFVAAHLRNGGPVHLGTAAIRAAARMVRREQIPGVEVERLTEFDARTDALWSVAGPTFAFAIERTAEYLNWRYLDPAGGGSHVLTALDGGRATGYAVFKRSDDWANVLDLVTHPDDLSVGASLLESGWEAMRDDGCKGLSCWLPVGHPYEGTLRAAGFDLAGRRAAVSVTSRDEPAKLVPLRQGGARLHITLGDFDFV